MLRVVQRLAFAAALAMAGAWSLAIATAKTALAEFQIQEAGVEKGEFEFEYRGAVHWGMEAPGNGDPLDEEEEGEFLRQSHDFEFAYGITERWKFSTTIITDQPLDQNYNVSGVELELQYELIKRKGNGLGLAFMGGYGFATRGGEADEIEFGPIIELASGNFLLTLNPFFGAQVGDNRDTDGLSFEYGWRGQYNFAKKWAAGVEMFGEIEDLSHAGPWDDQRHSIGPTLFYSPGGFNGDDDDDDDDDDNNNGRKVGGPPKMELSLNVGVQFGLTDMTSDTALKFQGALAF
jgi:hypothetical protein